MAATTACHPGRQQRLGAGRRAAMVTARFESDIHGRPTRFLASGLQGVNFGMLRPGTHMPAFTDDLVRR
jgi:hypothetical protein